MHDPAVHGIVVTHGTDTLEETAYLLDRTLDGDTPVVCTGAMRTSDHAEWDGTKNLTDAVRVAAAQASRGRGTQVVFNGRIWQGREAVKVNTVALDAFGAPFGKERGRVTEAVTYAGVPVRTRAVKPPALAARVAIIPMVIGDAARCSSARAAYDGVVIEAFGSGNLPPGAVPAIARWLDAKKPVVRPVAVPPGGIAGVRLRWGWARTVAMGRFRPAHAPRRRRAGN